VERKRALTTDVVPSLCRSTRSAVWRSRSGGREFAMDAHPEPDRDASPYDSGGNIHVPGAPGWRYRPLEPRDDESIAVTLAGPDDAEVRFIVPAFVSRGEE